MVAIRAKRRSSELLSALKDLLEDTQHSTHNCGDPDCCVAVARRLVAEIEGTVRPPGSAG